MPSAFSQRLTHSTGSQWGLSEYQVLVLRTQNTDEPDSSESRLYSLVNTILDGAQQGMTGEREAQHIDMVDNWELS